MRVIFPCLFIMFACGGGTSSSTCVPGKVEYCPCPRGGSGTQTCQSDGTWGPCIPCIEGEGVIFDSFVELAYEDIQAEANDISFDTPWTIPEASADLFSIVDVIGDSQVTSSCTPCGYGSLKGLVCAPNMKTFVPNALVTVDVVDCDQVAKEFQTHTDKDGAFYFPQLPCGTHVVHVTAGSFSTTYNVTIETGKTTDISQLGMRCFDAQKVKIAVFWGQWDKLQDLLSELGLAYKYYNYEADYFAGVAPEKIEAFQVLNDPMQLAQYDILFFNCGSAPIKWVSSYPTIRQNLRNYVLFGGSMYASDLAWEYVEGAFPDAVKFYGTNELPSEGLDPNGPQVAKDHQNIVAHIKDGVLAAYLGLNEFVAHYGSGPLIVVEAAGEGTVAHVVGKPIIKNPKYGQPFQPQYIEGPEGPLVLSFTPAEGAGRVVYTTFHNDEQVDNIILKVLHYLVFLL